MEYSAERCVFHEKQIVDMTSTLSRIDERTEHMVTSLDELKELKAIVYHTRERVDRLYWVGGIGISLTGLSAIVLKMFHII